MKRVLLVLAMLSASPAFAADVIGKTTVRTNAKTDVQAQQSGQDGSTVAQVSPNNTAQAGAGAGGEQVLPAVVQSALPTYSTNGNLVGLTVDASGRLYVTIDSTVTVQTNMKQINGAAPSATNPMPAQLTDGTSSYVGAKTGQLPTALGQQTMTNSVGVVIASNQSTLPVSQGAPTGAATARGTAVNIASAGTSTVTCVGSLTASTPLKLYQVEITGAAMGRCTIRYNNNASTTNWFDVVTSPNMPTVIAPCPAGFCGLTSGSTGTQAIEASCTNFDSAAQDFACSVQYCSSASGC